MTHSLPSSSPSTLFNRHGRRKYVCGSETRRFLACAAAADLKTQAFCWLLVFTGCRISEALSLMPDNIDAETGCVILHTLKRRRSIFRAVPVPPDLMKMLGTLARETAPNAPLWSWCRQTGWRRVKAVMESARVSGPHAMPKGLRHGFGIANAEQNIPPAITQRWLGHARLETTGIYQHAVGREERALAQRIWRAARAQGKPPGRSN